MSPRVAPWVLALSVLAGCGQNDPTSPKNAGTDPATSADRSQIEALIESAPELDFTFTDDEGAAWGEATTATATTSSSLASPADSGVGDATRPVFWARIRRPADSPPVRTVEFLEPPADNKALVKINVKFDGLFLVDRTDDGIRNPGRKPLRDELTRYALFRKVWFHPMGVDTDSVFVWRLVAISPTEFRMTDPAKQTVGIESVRFTGPNTDLEITDPAVLLRLRGDANRLPVFHGGEEVKVEAKVTNTDTGFDPPTFVYLHVPTSSSICPGPLERRRIRLRDNGTNGDVTAGDGIFTAIWTVRDAGVHHAAIDVINSRTLQNETDDDYNSTTWGIPYVAIPSWMP
jgi:hypothetical protein